MSCRPAWLVAWVACVMLATSVDARADLVGDAAVASSLMRWASLSESERVDVLNRVAELEGCEDRVGPDDLAPSDPLVSVRLLDADLDGDGDGDAIALVRGLCGEGGMDAGFIVRIETTPAGHETTDRLLVDWSLFEPVVMLDTAHARLWVELGVGHGSGYNASALTAYDVSGGELRSLVSIPLNLDDIERRVRGKVRFGSRGVRVDYRVTHLRWSDAAQDFRPRRIERGFAHHRWHDASSRFTTRYGGAVSGAVLARLFELE